LNWKFTATSSRADTVIQVPREFLVPGVCDFFAVTIGEESRGSALPAHNVQPHLFH
jgi:hypothetical protein